MQRAHQMPALQFRICCAGVGANAVLINMDVAVNFWINRIDPRKVVIDYLNRA